MFWVLALYPSTCSFEKAVIFIFSCWFIQTHCEELHVKWFNCPPLCLLSNCCGDGNWETYGLIWLYGWVWNWGAERFLKKMLYLSIRRCHELWLGVCRNLSLVSSSVKQSTILSSLVCWGVGGRSWSGQCFSAGMLSLLSHEHWLLALSGVCCPWLWAPWKHRPARITHCSQAGPAPHCWLPAGIWEAHQCHLKHFLSLNPWWMVLFAGN